MSYNEGMLMFVKLNVREVVTGTEEVTIFDTLELDDNYDLLFLARLSCHGIILRFSNTASCSGGMSFSNPSLIV